MGKVYVEGSPGVCAPGSLDESVMIFYNFLDNSQPDAGAAVFVFAIEALEYFKYPLTIFLVEAYSIVYKVNMMVADGGIERLVLA